jgi:hypothetical protein
MSDCQENDIQRLGCINGTQIAVQARGLGQRILVQKSETGQHLVQFLGFQPHSLPTAQVSGIQYWSLPHDRRVDELLCTSIDILISVRYVHPSLVQLELDLTDANL